MHSGTFADDEYLEGLGIWDQIARIFDINPELAADFVNKTPC